MISETAIESLAPEVDRTAPGGAAVRLLHVGRLVQSKGLRDVLSAMALTDASVRCDLDVAGDGPDRQACEQLSADPGSRIVCASTAGSPGATSTCCIGRRTSSSFRTFRGAGGNVAFEAMGWGLPLIVSDIGGPGAAVDDTCGFRVHPSTPGQFARDLASAIDRLAADPELRVRLGRAARKRVAAVGLWDAKIERGPTRSTTNSQSLGRPNLLPSTSWL